MASLAALSRGTPPGCHRLRACCPTILIIVAALGRGARSSSSLQESKRERQKQNCDGAIVPPPSRAHFAAAVNKNFFVAAQLSKVHMWNTCS